MAETVSRIDRRITLTPADEHRVVDCAAVRRVNRHAYRNEAIVVIAMACLRF